MVKKVKNYKTGQVAEDQIKNFLNYYKTDKAHLFLVKTPYVVAGVDLQIVDSKTATIGFWQAKGF